MILLCSKQSVAETAQTLLTLAGDEKIFLFVGPMGGGKTTLIKHLCHALGVRDVVNSPTFSLIHEYQTVQHTPVYHFDCYRIHALDEAIDLDFEHYFSSGCICFIEWPSKIASILPVKYFLVRIEIQAPTMRKLICSKVGAYATQ
ncbi:MAG TPA: tRNA (adenosine(37)-N6)-threonylcarbamoyltransferase complex ATPase subunit type 1 TsaE [Amoebophilaceae bacterium]|jgi:tRNA threonylcarbamoyladenosine biosynthesis protein TsaE|nr:tRNA (adenosine(37)-N6)-threonylcarbamoyltransferase complex ATPase subunit type 1 TsaE [Amoebophilaceae bacterium]